MGLRRRRSTSDRADGAGEVAAAVAGAADEVGRETGKKRKAGKAARRAGADDAGAGTGRRGHKPLTPARAKRMIGVGKAVAPMLAPYALAAAAAARARWDAYRAARLGVDPSQLAAYGGRGGALHARISRVAEALHSLESATEGTAPTAGQRFAADVRPRLTDLAVAVRAAEQMPTSRRRTAYRAIGAELDRIEVDLLTHLGVRAR